VSATFTFSLDFQTYAGNASTAAAFQREVQSEVATALDVLPSQVSAGAPTAGSIVCDVTVSDVPAAASQSTITTLQSGDLAGSLLAWATVSDAAVISNGGGNGGSTGASSSPTSSSSSNGSNSNDFIGTGLSMLHFILACAGGLVVLLLVCLGAFCCVRRKRVDTAATMARLASPSIALSANPAAYLADEGSAFDVNPALAIAGWNHGSTSDEWQGV